MGEGAVPENNHTGRVAWKDTVPCGAGPPTPPDTSCLPHQVPLGTHARQAHTCAWHPGVWVWMQRREGSPGTGLSTDLQHTKEGTGISWSWLSPFCTDQGPEGDTKTYSGATKLNLLKIINKLKAESFSGLLLRQHFMSFCPIPSAVS